jgi:hypothetical protein
MLEALAQINFSADSFHLSLSAMLQLSVVMYMALGFHAPPIQQLTSVSAVPIYK